MHSKKENSNRNKITNTKISKDNKKYIKNLLSTSSLFKNFSDDDLDSLVSLAQIKNYNTDETIIYQGDYTDRCVFFLLRGSVSVYVDKKYILSLKEPWDIFGEMSICSAAPRSATVKTNEKVKVLSIDASIVHAPGQEQNYKFKYFFFNMFAAIMSWKLSKTSERAKLYEDVLFQTKHMQAYSADLEKRLADNLQKTLLYSHMVNSAMESIFIMNLEGIITLANPKTFELLKISESELIGTSFETFIMSSGIESITADELLIEGQKSSGWSGELKIKRHEEKPFFAFVTVSLVKNNRNEKIGLSCIVKDITKYKEYELEIFNQKQKLEKAYQELQTLDKLKDDFLTLISHELRTPLSSILAYSETLAIPGLVEEDERNSFIDSINSEAQRLDHLITKVLDLSKMESGQMLFTYSKNSIIEVIEEIVDKFKNQIEEKGLKLTLKLENEKTSFCFDRKKIFETFDHIIENAVNFTEKGEIQIEMNQNDDFTIIKFTDTGIGIAENNIKKVFNKFEQIEDISFHNRGIGLGMPLSKLIVEAHKGKIWVESKPDEGSTFYLELPHNLEQTEDNSDDDYLSIL